MHFFRRNFCQIVLVFLLLIGFLYRIQGLERNYSFWSDEEHVAIFARAILERGRPILANGYHTGLYQWLQYWLSAVSAKVFGLNEFAIRFPSVIFGVLTIWAIYLLGKELFNKNVGLAAAVLIAFLKIEILWSRQARPYQALQFFYLLGAYFIYKLAKEKKFNWRHFLGFLGCGVLASLMHGMGLVIFFVGFLYLLIFRFSWFKKTWTALGLVIPLIFSYIFRVQILATASQIGKINNLFYYRVFLWHNYSLLVFLALIGFLYQFFKKKANWQVLVLFLAIQGIIASFFLGQPFVRYFYIVFPFLVLLSAVGLGVVSRYLSSLVKLRKYPISNIQYLILFTLSFFIIAMGNKFTLIPRKVYSLNEDMQEIPEVDWKIIYNFVGEKLSQDEDVILVTNWNDLPIWFLGEGELDYFIRTPGEIRVEKDPVSSAILIYSLEEFKDIIKTKKKGILIIDSWDDRVPVGIREYCRETLKKELEIDRLYPTQPRYWPVEIYSWGIEE